MDKKSRPSKEILERLYLEEEKSTHEIAKELSVSQETVRKWLIMEGVQRRSHSESLIIGTKRPEKEDLEGMYATQGKTAKMIASDLGVPTETVYSWLKKYDIPRRESYDSVVLNGGSFGGWNKTSAPAKEVLSQMYVTERKSAPSIGKVFGVSESTVRFWLRDYEIEIRDQSEAHKVNGNHLNKEWLRDQYIDQKKSTVTIAQEEGVDKKTIIRALEGFGIPRRTTSEALRNNPKRSGENNPAWNGGLSSYTKQLRYSAEYLEACRIVRKRDKCCLLCASKGIDSEGKKFEVHHIDPISEALLLVFDPGNMILLCQDCHLKIRGKERQWKRKLHDLVGTRFSEVITP